MTVKERLKTFIKHNNITTKAFETSIAASNGYVNSITKSIGLDKLEKIIEIYPNLNLTWLLTGDGNMLKLNSVNDAATTYTTIRNEKFKDISISDLVSYIIQNEHHLLQDTTFVMFIEKITHQKMAEMYKLEYEKLISKKKVTK